MNIFCFGARDLTVDKGIRSNLLHLLKFRLVIASNCFSSGLQKTRNQLHKPSKLLSWFWVHIWAQKKNGIIFHNPYHFWRGAASAMEIFQSGWKWDGGTKFFSGDLIGLKRKFPSSKWSSNTKMVRYSLDINAQYKRWFCCIAAWGRLSKFLLRVTSKWSSSWDYLKKHYSKTFWNFKMKSKFWKLAISDLKTSTAPQTSFGIAVDVIL